MGNTNTISTINKVLKSYFDKYNNISVVPAKDLMSQFIDAGVFPSNQKNGLPIRNLLRQLDKANQLHLIPYVLPERKQKNTNWFFTAKSGIGVVSEEIPKKKPTVKKAPTRQTSDEAYVIDLCDEILGEQSLRQHKFDFLLGDKSSSGKQRKLPVDAYYPIHNLVIEYREIQHTKPVSHFDKPHIQTVSGVHRGEQRRIYDQRRRHLLPKHGIALKEVSYTQFVCDNRGKIIRNNDRDRKTLQEYLILSKE